MKAINSRKMLSSNITFKVFEVFQLVLKLYVYSQETSDEFHLGVITAFVSLINENKKKMLFSCLLWLIHPTP